MANSSVTIDDEFPRYKESNPLNYTKVELAKKKKMMMDIKKDYPDLPDAWIEMVLDFEKITPPEKLIQIIEEGEFEYAGKFSSKKNKTNL